MGKKILLLGHTGKMGSALNNVFKDDYLIIGKNSKNFDATNFNQVRNVIEEVAPDIVINTVAFLGIDPSEQEPYKAFQLNTLYPKFIAELSNEKQFTLVHFSTDAVFNNEKKDFYIESDTPCPLNIYGLTKYGGDCFIKNIAKNYYIFRISVLFGETYSNVQFVEKMLQMIKKGKKTLKISDNIVLSPSYSKDIAREIKKIIEASYDWGLYHIANEGKVSLYDLMVEIAGHLNIDVCLEKASYEDFPYVGIKNTYTPIKTEKLDVLRSWKIAVKEYCDTFQWRK